MRIFSKFITIYEISTSFNLPTYLKNTHLYRLQTQIKTVQNNKIQLFDTIYHPQGGGQPNDQGCIAINDKTYPILRAQIDKQTGKIWHFLKDIEGIKQGQKVIVDINKNVRQNNAKIHSAGHLIDLSVQNLGLNWKTTKGYHFQRPWVQYEAKLDSKQFQNTIILINDELKRILSSSIQIKKQIFTHKQAVQSKWISNDFKVPYVRIISFGKNSCPCTGTHIESLTELQKVEVSKIQKKKKNIRVYYETS